MFIFNKKTKIELINNGIEMFKEETIYSFFYFIKIRITKESMEITDLNKLYKKTTKIKGFKELA